MSACVTSLNGTAEVSWSAGTRFLSDAWQVSCQRRQLKIDHADRRHCRRRQRQLGTWMMMMMMMVNGPGEMTSTGCVSSHGHQQ